MSVMDRPGGEQVDCSSQPGQAAPQEQSQDPGGSENAEPPEASSEGYLEHYARPFRIDRAEFGSTQRYFWSRLAHPTSQDKMAGSLVLGTAFALWSQKIDFQADMARRGTPDEHDAFLEKAGKLGGGAAVPGMALLFYFGGSAFQDYRTKQTGFMLVESLFLTDIVTAFGRWVLAEDRPKYGGALHPFRGYGGGVSGHSATAASISGVLSRMYLQVEPDDGHASRLFKRIGKVFVYGAPVLVAYSRIHEEQHYAYNTVLGLSIGYWTGNVVADAHHLYLESPAMRWKPESVGPIASDRGAPGIAARWVF